MSLLPLEILQTPETSPALLQGKPFGRRQSAVATESDIWRRPISMSELLIASVVTIGLGAILVAWLAPRYPYYLDTFHLISAAIRHWNFKGLPANQPKEFWGFAYVAAAVAAITRIPDIYSAVLVAASMFVVASYLCGRLWGTTIAAWFMGVNWWYIDGAVEGLSEPLFMALVFGSFIAMRKEKWAIAALLASGATVVRPVGIFVLLAMGIVLLWRKEYRQLAIAVSIGAAIGIAYMIPMQLIYGNPLANVSGYRTSDWAGYLPVGLPFVALFKGAAHVVTTWHVTHPGFVWRPLVEELVTATWVLVTLAGVVKMGFDNGFRRYARAYPAEAIFAGSYATFLFCYNSDIWSWDMFVRFALPLAPFLLLVFLNKGARDRRILYPVVLFNVLLSAWPKIPPIHQVFALIRTGIGIH